MRAYQKNLKVILEAIKGRGITTAERMIEEEIKEEERQGKREKKKKGDPRGCRPESKGNPQGTTKNDNVR